MYSELRGMVNVIFIISIYCNPIGSLIVSKILLNIMIVSNILFGISNKTATLNRFTKRLTLYLHFRLVNLMTSHFRY